MIKTTTTQGKHQMALSKKNVRPAKGNKNVNKGPGMSAGSQVAEARKRLRRTHAGPGI